MINPKTGDIKLQINKISVKQIIVHTLSLMFQVHEQ